MAPPKIDTYLNIILENMRLKTNLERNKRYTFHYIANQKQILERPEGRHIYSYIHKCDPD